jgi:hypothetical protein
MVRSDEGKMLPRFIIIFLVQAESSLQMQGCTDCLLFRKLHRKYVLVSEGRIPASARMAVTSLRSAP